MTIDKIVKEKYSAVFNSTVADKNRRIAEIKTPQKLPAIRYAEWPPELENLTLADYCAYFEERSRGKKDTAFDFTDNQVEEIVAGTHIPLENGKVLVKRLKP